MKLLFVIDSLGSGGAQRQMVTLALGLKSRGHEVAFFIYYPEFDHFALDLETAGIPVFAVQKHSRFETKVFFELRNVIRLNKYDLVLAFLNTPSFYAELASVGIDVPVVVSERFVFTEDKLPLSLWSLQQIHHLANFITVNSYYQHDNMISHFSWMKTKLQVIYNGVDLDKFRPSDSSLLEKEPNTIIAVGTINERKNPENLARALVMYKQFRKDPPKIIWVGKREDNGNYSAYEETNAILSKASLTDRWVWLGERTDVADLLRKAEVLVHPSFFEGLPNAVCEAFSSGLPVLASNVCEHPRLVEEGVTGFLFDPLKPQQIAEALFRYFSLSEKKKTLMRYKVREFAEIKLGLDVYVDQYEKLFFSLVPHSQLVA